MIKIMFKSFEAIRKIFMFYKVLQRLESYSSSSYIVNESQYIGHCGAEKPDGLVIVILKAEQSLRLSPFLRRPGQGPAVSEVHVTQHGSSAWLTNDTSTEKRPEERSCFLPGGAGHSPWIETFSRFQVEGQSLKSGRDIFKLLTSPAKSNRLD